MRDTAPTRTRPIRRHKLHPGARVRLEYNGYPGVSKALSLTWATVVETSHALAGSGRRGSDATWLLVVPDSERSVRRIRVDQVREVAGEVGVYPVINDRERRLLAYGPRSCEAAREAERQIADYVQRQIADYVHGAVRDA